MAYTFQQVDSNTVNVFSSNGSLVARTSIANAQQNYGYNGGTTATTSASTATPAATTGGSAATTAGTPVDALTVSLANAAKQGATSYQANGRTWLKQADGSWSNGVDSPVSAANISAAANAVASGSGWVIPATTSQSSSNNQSVQQQATAVQSQISSDQAQLAALTKYGLTNTDQLAQDAQGNWVPKTTTQTNQQSNQQTSQTQNPNNTYQVAGGGTVTAQTSSAVQYNSAWATYGITAQVWSTLSATQQATVAASMSAANSLYASTGSTVTLDKALQVAAQDPTIAAKYADQAKIDASDLQTSLNNIATSAAITAAGQKISMSNDTKALAEQYSKAGMAYSGFRQKAAEDLKTTQGGIIESTAQDLKSQIQKAGEAVETQLGSAALNGIAMPQVNYTNPLTGTAQNLGYTPIGGLTGSDVSSEQQDVNKLASQYVAAGTTPAVKAS
jgi:hypothetical protein